MIASPFEADIILHAVRIDNSERLGVSLRGPGLNTRRADAQPLAVPRGYFDSSSSSMSKACSISSGLKPNGPRPLL